MSQGEWVGNEWIGSGVLVLILMRAMSTIIIHVFAIVNVLLIRIVYVLTMLYVCVLGRVIIS